MAFAHVFNKGGTDKTIVPNSVRTWAKEPFQAPDWLDLRVGFLLSLTDESTDDTITGLTETIGGGAQLLGKTDRYWIGVKTRDDNLPTSNGTVFIGFNNAPHVRPNAGYGSSALQSSDGGIGTTNTNFWRPSNGQYAAALGSVIDGNIVRAYSVTGCQQHFVQNVGGAGGYATLLMLRLVRDTSTSHRITVTTKTSAGFSGDVLFTNTPTKDLLLTNMQAFPTTVQQWGPVGLSAVPDALYVYWPFRQSRLRLHAWGVLKSR